jgi:hypothetical protein
LRAFPGKRCARDSRVTAAVIASASEAIQIYSRDAWIASELTLLAMTKG